MHFSNLKLFRPATRIIVPKNGINDKNICFIYYPENSKFLDTFRYLEIYPPLATKHVFVPTIVKPFRSVLTIEYRKELMGHKLKPLKAQLSKLSEMKKVNFFLEYGTYIELLEQKYKITRYDVGRPYLLLKNLINTANNIPSEKYEKVLLYSVDLDSPFNKKIIKRRIWPIYLMLLENVRKKTPLPFDKLLLHLYMHDGSTRFILLFDKNQKSNIQRVKSIIAKLRMRDAEKEEEFEEEMMSVDSVENSEITKDLDDETKEKLKSVVKNYLRNDPITKAKYDNDQINHTELVSNSVLYNVTNDKDTINSLAKRMTDVHRQKIVNKFVTDLIPKEKLGNVATNVLISSAKPEELNDNQNPKHILQKRKIDFSENLKQDIIDSFKTLESKPFPLKLVKMEVKTIQSGHHDLRKSINDHFTITLKDDLDKDHSVKIELPHLTENGTFFVNGQEKLLVNQMVTYPIFFPKPFTGMFQSSYAVFRIHSKRLKNTAYLIMFMGGYKFPITVWLAYKYGFNDIMNYFNITYTISDEPTGTKKEIKLPNGKYILFKTESNDELAEQIIQSFIQIIPSLPKDNLDLTSSKTWQYALEKEVGNRNCTYILDQVANNIVTPIEKKILASKGDPTELKDIIKYICSEVINGKIDDRNSIEKQRVRTSEMFTSEIQNQIHSAYNEYQAKRLAGDETALLYINPTKTNSLIINSQNINPLENINPIEELSSMTRITPIGQGGIASKEEYPQNAMNIHYTYFGNIDPLETPDSADVGIQQHLTIGSSISNVRGLFEIKDPSMVKPTEILSVTPSLIPFVESNEGVRVAMASAQAKQAIALRDKETPAVQTGFESIYTQLLSTNFIKKSPVDGVITEINDQFIIVKSNDTGVKYPIDVTPVKLRSGQGKYGLSKFESVVSIGDKVKKNQIISEGANIKDGLISNGVNMLVAFMPWKGFNFEDGMVISESAAKRFTSVHVEEEEVLLTEDDDIAYIANVGETIDKGERLITYSNAIYDVESYKHLRTEGGTIVNIEVYCNIAEEDIPEKLWPAYERFKNAFIVLNGKYPLGHFKKYDKIKGILIKFVVQQELSLKKGDKLNNRHFNKGVVAVIEPDSNMPLTPWGQRIDMCYSPISILSRMNTGQLLEMYCGLIGKKLANIMTSQPRNKFVPMYTRVIKLLDGTQNQQYSTNVLKKLNSLSDHQYNALVSKIASDKFIPIICPPFKSPSSESIQKALIILGLQTKYNLEIPGITEKSEAVAVGYLYVSKLEHQVEKKLHGRGIGPYVAKTGAPTGGKRRGGGQKMGEGDLYSLLAMDSPHIIEEFFGPLSSDQVTKNQMVYDVIQNGTTTFMPSKTNPVKDMFGQLMIAIHLDAD